MKLSYKMFLGFLFIIFFVLISFTYILFISFGKIEEKSLDQIEKGEKLVKEYMNDFVYLKEKEVMQLAFDGETEKLFDSKANKIDQIEFLNKSENLKEKIFGTDRLTDNFIIAFLSKDANLIAANYGVMNWKDVTVFPEIKQVMTKNKLTENGLSYYSIYRGFPALWF